MGGRRWTHARRNSRGELDVKTFPAPEGAPTVALVDPYYGTAPDLTPLEKVISEFTGAMADVDAVIFRDVDPFDANGSVPSEVAELLSAKFGRDVEVGTLSLTDESGVRRLRYVHRSGVNHNFERFEAELRQLEIRAQIDRSGAVYRPANAHILLPSGDHSDVYLRLADVFDDPTSVMRMADWLDHRVSAQTILVADTWTILPLLQELSRRHGQVGVRDRSAPPIHTFVEYPDADGVRQTFERLAAQAVSRAGGVLAIVSIVSSGGLLENLRRLQGRYLPGVRLDVVAVVNTNPSIVVDSLCVFPHVQRYVASQCPLCQSSETQPLVSIDPKRYFPSFKGRRTARMITPEIAGQHRAFWQQADQHKAIRVHADVSVLTGPGREVRHREIAIDVVPLLEKDPGFRVATLDCLAKFCNRCDVAVVPNHGACEALLSLARALYPDVRCVPLDVPWGTTGREQLEAALGGARRILILDDSVVSGRTLRLIHRQIQDVISDARGEREPAGDYQIAAFAVIGRPHNEGQWARLQDSLRQDGRRPFLHCYQQIFMPDGPCPWCDERDRIDRVRRRLRSPALFEGQRASAYMPSDVLPGLDTRYELLSPRRTPVGAESGDRIAGLGASIFLCGKNGELGARDPEQLTWHSLFGERLGEAATYAAVATAMHEVRLKAQESLEGRQAAVWEWDWAAQRILTGYHDPLIQASFLRAAHAEELRFRRTPELEAAVEEAFFSISSSTREVSPMLAAEHKWAALAQKYSPQVRELILSSADGALSAQAQGGGGPSSIQPLIQYLGVLQEQLLLPARAVLPSDD